MNNNPVDLSALDPASDPARLRRMTNTILAQAARALAARRRAPTVITELASWTRAVLSAAVVVCLLSAPVLLRGRSTGKAAPRAPDLGSAAVIWVVDGRTPTVGELLYAMGERGNDTSGQ
jgi:hypothetical protein